MVFYSTFMVQLKMTKIAIILLISNISFKNLIHSIIFKKALIGFSLVCLHCLHASLCFPHFTAEPFSMLSAYEICMSTFPLTTTTTTHLPTFSLKHLFNILSYYLKQLGFVLFHVAPPVRYVFFPQIPLE